MINPLQRLVGPFSKPLKITALTHIIPRGVRTKTVGKYFSTLIPFKTENFLLSDVEETNYLVAKSKFEYLVSKEDIDDWSYLLRRFDSLIGNLIRLLNNMRRIYYRKVVYLKRELIEIKNRHSKLQEKLLEKTEEKKDKKRTFRTDKQKLDELGTILSAMGFAAAEQGFGPPGSELDAATLDQVRASGADMIAAAHLATLEASSPQQVADVMQVILNRAKGQSGGIPAVITAREQFTPYSAAIYGGSPGDPAASAKYGRLGVTKAEIFQLASQPNGLQALTNRFNAGNPSVAAQVLTDIRSNGPLITSSRKFVGGAQYFTGYPTKGSRRRPDGGNYFRDSYATGAILIPELFDNHVINYQSTLKKTLLSNFIVDRPTVFDVQKIGEPVIIIPMKRPIGISVLKTLFKEPFRRIESVFAKSVKKEQIPDKKNKQQIPIKNNQTSINRTTIPAKNSLTGSTSSAKQIDKDIVTKGEDYQSKNAMIESGELDYLNKIIQTIQQNITAPPTIQSSKLNLIDTTEQKTSDVFGNDKKVILLTQEIEVIEE
jgi:hypothetical protein